MRLRYTKPDGTVVELELSERPLTIGRSQDADIVLLDEKASRIHCGIRLWDGDFYIKDLKSKNGVFVNGQRVEVSKLKPGDVIRVGSATFNFEQDPNTGADTALREIKGEMELGKGYTTILRQIVDDSDSPSAAPAAAVPSAPAPSAEPAAPATAESTPAPAAAPTPSVPAEGAPATAPKGLKFPLKKPIRIMIKKKAPPP
jgi:pSer/pThr/pTyr-binding forkhead associated (FHA) protein